MIELSGVSKTFKKTKQKKANKYLFTTIYETLFLKRKPYKTAVLTDINLKINQGDRVAFIGRNRSGKTTLMHIVSNILRPTKGNIWIKGKVVPIFGLGVGFNNILSGKENLILNATSLGAPYSWVKNNIQAIQEFSEIDDSSLNMPLKFYSNGMKARLALSIAISIRSEILILDEVLDGVDVFFKRKTLDKIIENALKYNTTLLVVSHDEDVLKILCTSVVYLKNGMIMERGGLDLIDKYKNELN